MVTRLKTGGVHQAETFPKDHRPWGWFETLAIRGRFQVKRVLVNPGASLVYKAIITAHNIGSLLKVRQK